MNLIFSPVNVTIDYEKAIINAVTGVWPENNIIVCRFNLNNSWWKKIQSLGLSNEYKEKNSEVGKLLRHTFGLLFLDAQDVSDCFSYDFLVIDVNDVVSLSSNTSLLPLTTIPSASTTIPCSSVSSTIS
ncbi:hypothetical protein QTP88_000669 [Uroleucon formosanum]